MPKNSPAARPDNARSGRLPSPSTLLPSDRTSLLKIATAARRFVEPIWEEWHRHAGADRPAIAAVLVVDRMDNRYNKDNRDAALPEFVLARKRAVDDIWPRWQRINLGGPKGSVTP
ncbi:hypothetical protein M2267_002334 [Ensifer sp. KUDG1]|uniref:hypothetical protein n=1 Tax=Ensifer sp. KUDG1 TaxID=3373919 RepID=UPI003D22675B